MLSKPEIVERAEVHYLAVPVETAQADIARIAPDEIRKLFATLGKAGVAPAGPMMFRYHSMDGGRMSLDIAVPVAETEFGADGLVSGSLPAGRYASIEYRGGYEGLYKANAVLREWMEAEGHHAMPVETNGRRNVAGWAEIYRAGPEIDPDPETWVTEIVIKVAD